MKKTIFGFVALAIAFTFGTMVSCSEKVEEEQPMQVAAVNDSIEAGVIADGDTLFIEGTVAGFCHCNGMILDGANFGCRMEGEFDSTLVGTAVRVRGVFHEEQMDSTFFMNKLAEIQAADTVKAEAAEAVEVAEEPAKEGCCEKGEEKCCGMDTTKLIEKINECRTNGKGYISKFYIEVVTCEPVVAEETPAE